MKNIKYKDQNKKNYKILLIVLFVMIFILLFMLISLKIVKKNIDDNIILSYDELKTVKDVVEYHKSKYISEELSKQLGYSLDVYLKFKVALYDENNESNEEYYNTLINDIARIINFKSFRLFDSEHNINIDVICNGKEVQKIIVNGMEDYFIYMDSKLSIKKYKEIPTTEFSIASPILQKYIDNNWEDNVYLGERDSIFNNYNIYFDEGIKVRIINGKIYNIIFTKKYNENVIENFFPGVDLKSIESSLGEATFKNDDLKIIGYKGKENYVFFTEDEISIYRNSEIDSDDFFDLADKYIDNELDLLEFMNELTYLWPDYSEYSYTESSFFIAYPLKGIEISVNNDDINGFLVYNNNKSTLSKIGRYLENTNFVGRLQKDSVFEAEQRRLEEERELVNLAKDYNEQLEDDNIIGQSFNYDAYPIKDNNGYIYKIKFIAKDDNRPNREINDSIDSFLWVTNDYFLFSKSGKGIYFYNLTTGKTQRVFTGKAEFIFKGFENGILKYDDKELELQF